MTNILAHKVLQALLMLATSDICPDADWYGEELNTPDTVRINIDQCFIKDYHGELQPVACSTRHQKRISCPVPLAPDMNAKDARAFYTVARKLARGAK